MLLLCCSAPRTPVDDSVVGFQVDKLMNVIQGEAKIKITVYEHEQGQVGGNVCVSQSVSHQPASQSVSRSASQSVR